MGSSRILCRDLAYIRSVSFFCLHVESLRAKQINDDESGKGRKRNIFFTSGTIVCVIIECYVRIDFANKERVRETS